MTVSSMPYDQRWLRKTVRNSMLTALAMDSLGTILEDYSPDDRVQWLQGDRNTYPKAKKPRRASFNTDFMILMMAVMAQVSPSSLDDLLEYRDELQLALNTYYYAVASPRSDNRYVRTLRGESNTGIAIPVGMFLGMYAAVVQSDRSFLYALVDETCRGIGLKNRDRDDVRMYAFLACRLAQDGYFGYTSLRELMAHRAVPPFLFNTLKHMMRHHVNVEYLSEPYVAAVVVHGCSSAEVVITESMFYMCRVDASFPRHVLPSGPKDQLVEVFTSEANALADIAFVYGGLCTLSEQNYSLLTKPLRESVPARKIVDDFFRYV